MNPRVSAIVIFFNEEEVLDAAIASVVAQTYSNWELLLIDDGSTDRSGAIGRRWEREHPDRVRCHSHDGGINRGASAARNLGIRHARGEFVAFLDADDLWLPEKLAHQVEVMASHPGADMVCGTTIYAYHWEENATAPYKEARKAVGAPPGRDHARGATSRRYEAVAPACAALQDRLAEPPVLATLLYPLGLGLAPCPSNLLLRKSAVERIGGFEENFRGDLQLYEDQVFLTKIYLSSGVFISSAALDIYRIRSSSCVARVTREGKYHAVRRAYLEWLEQYLDTEGIDGPNIASALRSSLFPYRHPIAFRAREAAHGCGRIARNSVGKAASRLLPKPVHARLRGALGIKATGPRPQVPEVPPGR